MEALERFEKEFRGWVSAHNKAKKLNNDPDARLAMLTERISQEIQRQIGNGFNQGWLETEPEAKRGYFVREVDHQSTNPHRRGEAVFYGDPPNWEFFVQLADFAALKAAAERHGHRVRLEDNLMDITVEAKDGLLLYVENKLVPNQAEKLIEGMMQWADKPVPMEDRRSTRPDNIKKVQYMLDAERRLALEGKRGPRYFAVSTADNYRRLFRVEYLGENRLGLAEESRGFSDIFADYAGCTSEKQRPSPQVNQLHAAIRHHCGDRVWTAHGSGQTAFNLYTVGEAGDAVLAGIYDDGTIWTDNRKLGEGLTARLADGLGKIGIVLKADKAWPFWRRGDSKVDLHDEDVLPIAEALAAALR